MRIVRTLCLSVLVLAVVPAASAFANCSSNVRSATLSAGDPATVTEYAASHPTGAPMTTKKIHPGSFIYEFSQGGTVVYGKNTFKLGVGSIATFQCSAESAHAPADRPEINLFSGALTLATTATRPGEILLTEGLITTNPGGPFKVVIKVHRTPVTTSYDGMMMWYRNLINQPQGITTLTARPGIDVTPYVGKGVGNCRYSTTRAKLSSRGRRNPNKIKKGDNGGGSSSFWQGHHKVS